MRKKKPPSRQSDSKSPQAPVAVNGGSTTARRAWLLPTIVLALLALLAVGYALYADKKTAATENVQAFSSLQAGKPGFVGAETCAGCHAAEAKDWQGSQHANAMQHATEKTVLGDFNHARFAYNGVVTTFFRRDGRFFVNTDGADGKLADFEIRYAFGIDPLQQYLIEFPDGRLQALSIAWDARPKAQGGSRWYHLYAAEKIDHQDPLHWTRQSQNWNWMCADCHTTKLDRNFNTATNTYATRFAEMNVSCEACHGPGAKHVAWAKAPDAEKAPAGLGLAVALDERQGVAWLADHVSGNAARSKPLSTQRELGVCAQCHARRAPFVEGMNHDGSLLDSHEIALLTDALYFPDGQQRDEVYNVGSFLQSKMHSKGVTCSDCHHPHTGKLRLPGNATCAQCHAPQKYAAPAHTMHAPNSTGASCASCHMPTKTYMGVDARHDHSFRIPRPDLSDALGTPNACTSCHQDKNAVWAADRIEKHFGPERKGFQRFGATLQSAHAGAPDAPGKLAALADSSAPAIVRATALAEMRAYLSAASLPTLERGLADGNAMVRAAALDALMAAPPQERVRLAAPLIDDPSHLVRVKVGRVLAVAPNAGMAPAMRTRVEKVFAEYVASQAANADRPESQVNLGLFYGERREPLQAEAAYRAALRLDAGFVPAYINLADLYRSHGRDAEAENSLNTGLQQAPGNAGLSHALGLLRIRQGRVPEAMPLLAQASQAAPDNPRFAYVYGIALHDSGDIRNSIAVLEQALGRAPNNRELLSALADYARETGDAKRQAAYAKRLAAFTPN
jgi:Tfp pilus assembly protein PilF